LGRGREDGEEVHEVAATVPPVGFRADEEHAVGIPLEVAALHQPLGDLRAGLIDQVEVAPPLRPGRVADAAFLQAQRQQLLDSDVARRWRRDDRLHESVVPQPEKAGRLKERCR
jgi:hypothetical protein